MQNKSTQTWIDYYKSKKPSNNLKLKFLTSYQKEILKEISEKAKRLLKEKNQLNILSAGSGIDIIAYYLKKQFKEKVNITLLDISPICISQNKSFLGKDFNYIVADIFSFSTKEKYDIIYNTGLLEHFFQKEQSKIILKIKSCLNKNSYYITLNPSNTGKIYKKGMQKAIEKKIWKYGKEVPIKSLKPFQSKDFLLEKEFLCCSITQLSFLKYYNIFLFYLFLPLLCLTRFIYLKQLDNLLGKFIGFYGLLSIFRKV